MKTRFFTIREANFIRDNYLTMTDKEIAQKLGRKKLSIHNYRIRENLIKPIECNSGCFTKGLTPWNKGKSGYMGANVTSFKKGHRSANVRPVGTVFQIPDGTGKVYSFIKLAHHRQYPYGRYVWEQATGESLSKDEMISFKDGNQLNCVFDNLVKLTRKENALRNANREKAAKSLKKNWDAFKTLQAYGIQFSKFKRQRTKKAIQVAVAPIITTPNRFA